MQPEFSLAQLASRLGLDDLTADDAELSLQRHGFEVAIPGEILQHLDPATALGRHLAWGVFFGVRLAIDHQNHVFNPAEERLGDEALYGGRLPRLVNTVTMSWFEELSGAPLFTTDWLLDTLKIAYVFEVGKYAHAWSEEDVEKMPFLAEKLIKDARYALFYDSYRLKPQQNLKHPEGLIRIFEGAEGLGATRALLMPDFDYDAAREGGCFAIPSRDTMIIGRPYECEDAPALRKKVEKISQKMLQEAPYPLCSAIFDMTHDQAFAGPNPAVDGAAAHATLPVHHLPHYNDGVKAVRAPTGVHIYASDPG